MEVLTWCVQSSQILAYFFDGPSFVTILYFFQSSSVLQSRLASARAEGDTFTSNDVTANDNHQLLVGSIINPRGFSKEGELLKYLHSFPLIYIICTHLK